MKTIIVAVTAPNTPLVSMLPPSFVHKLDTTIVYHNSAHTSYEGGVMVCNYDYHLDFSTKPDMLSSLCVGDRYIHQPRYSKIEQMLKLYEYNTRDTDRRIDYPEHYTVSINSVHGVSSLSLVGAPKSDLVLIKPVHGARGEGHVLLPTHLLYEFLEEAVDLTNDEIQERFPAAILSPPRHEGICSFKGVHDVIVSSFIENITVEYRLIVAGRYLYLFPRKIKEGDYPQANLTKGEDGLLLYSELKDSRILESDQLSIRELVKELGIVYGSIDLYKTRTGELGVFEFSNEFGVSRIKPSLVRSFIIDATLSIVNKNEANNE